LKFEKNEKNMKRRDSLKAIALTTFGIGVNNISAKANPELLSTEGVLEEFKQKDPDKPGSTAEEIARDRKLKADKFLTKAELATLAILCDIIVPADGISGSATQAGVPAFIEFMVKDQPTMQTPMRGGLRWLDVQCLKKFDKKFSDCSPSQRIEMVDLIAYPKDVKPEYAQGAKFFSLVRNLTLTGFYTSEMGIKDIGYKGNTPNNWEGVPDAVLKKFGLSYG
jgi:gluconate 2-dehydrogenase gamma chain